MKNTVKKIRFCRLFSITAAVGLMFWWPLSHLFYSGWYHGLLGFAPGSYPQDMVTVIGICGFLPVLNLLLIAWDPVRNKGLVFALMLFSALLAFMYVYLMAAEAFPRGEVVNIAMCLLFILVYTICTPWNWKNPA